MSREKLLLKRNKKTGFPVCPKCGADMRWDTSGGMHFDAGVVYDDITTSVYCLECGFDINENEVEIEE